MNLIGDLGSTELGFALLLFGTMLLAIVFAIQTAILSRRLRQQEAQRNQMEEIAFCDPLTRLPNRRLLLDRLQRALYTAERENSNTAIFFVDLDNFKQINDRFGHATGDAVLEELARRWGAELRAVDTLARWGGDEFVIITGGIMSASDIHLVAGRLQHASSAPLSVMGHQIQLSISIGVSVGCVGTDEPEDLIRCADVAMYRAKRSGGKPAYEIVGKAACIERITGLELEPAVPAPAATEYVRVLA
ncbi:hypothetical protein BH23CHL2_BH23CHL2_05440 [soil metagenome]